MTPKVNNKVLILTGKAGQGHVSIAKALEYWTSQWGFEPKVVDVLPGYINTTYKISLKTKTHEPMYKIMNNHYLSKLAVRGFNGSLMERVETLCPDFRDYDVAISTHPFLHPDFAKVNIIIIPDPTVHKTYFAKPNPQFYISYWVGDKKFELLGPIARRGFYNELKYRTKHVLKKDCGFDPNKTTVLILAGGEWINRSQDYIDMLGYGFDHDEFEFIFICGKNERFQREMQQQYDVPNFKFLGWKNDEEMNMIMRAGDCGLCFSTGSAVITESGICKLPLYIVDTLGAQENGYIQIVEKRGVGKYLKGGYWEKIDQLKDYLPKTQKMFERNLNKWGDYLMNRPKVWEEFFTRKVLTGN